MGFLGEILKKAKEFPSWEVYSRVKRSSKISAEGGKKGKVLSSLERLVALRVIDEGKVLFFHLEGSEDFSKDALKKISAFLEPDDYRFPRPGRIPRVEAFDPQVLEDFEEFGEEFSREMEDASLSFDKRITAVRHSWYQETVIEDTLVNSEGFESSFKRTTVSSYIELKASDGGSEEMGYSYGVGIRRADLSPLSLGREAAQKAISLLRGGPVKSGSYRAVLSSEVASDFLSVFSSSVLGENVIKGRSLLSGKLGKKIASGEVTIVDSGLSGVFPFPFDGEGVPASESIVVENGILNCFLYDSYWGMKAGVPSTGNSVRPSDLSSPPALSVTNFMLLPGKADLEEFLRSESEILLVEEIMGLHLANPVTGEFSLGASGRLFSRGEERGVKSITVTGDVFSLLERVAMVFDDMRFWGRFGSPSLLVDGLDVVGS